MATPISPENSNRAECVHVHAAYMHIHVLNMGMYIVCTVLSADGMHKPQISYRHHHMYTITRHLFISGNILIDHCGTIKKTICVLCNYTIHQLGRREGEGRRGKEREEGRRGKEREGEGRRGKEREGEGRRGKEGEGKEGEGEGRRGKEGEGEGRRGKEREGGGRRGKEREGGGRRGKEGGERRPRERGQE